MTTPRIRVVLAEDQTMVLGALAALLDLERDIEVVAQAANGVEALAAVEAHAPDILITDVEMPELSGLDVAAQLRHRVRTRVIVLTTFARSGYLRRALEAGVNGYLLKARPARELADAVRRVHRGLRVIDPQLAAESWDDPDPLTDRQREVLRLSTEGMSTADIAARLALSAGTVRNYLSEAIARTSAANRIEAARIARKKGWL
ncbi:MAG TPA: response regulator transcription factor [Povalibacter sp.]|uniref:response regulator transcription factor n=1 Tax=Povalibacter sp. TaxID=1962978 RepID=UPI002C257B48|nr:response regulator transcription factor [Povalibacter sp.]HMN44549.1 response regulator transcription factor [Povalibacter sp.]